MSSPARHGGRAWRVRVVRRSAIGVAAAAVIGGATMAAADAVPTATPTAAEAVETADASQAVAPYLYNGWGDTPDPAKVMDATGVKWFTLAFVLSQGTCDPQWDGSRPLAGGVDAQTVDAIRAKGGDVIPSFGGASGSKLEQSCQDASALAGAYQKVIDAYDLTAIDIDIEGDAYSDPQVQQKTIDALKQVKAGNSGLTTYVTFPSAQDGPDDSMIKRAAGSGLEVDGWTIMPFDFGDAGDQDMGDLTKKAAEGLKNTVKDAYGYSDDEAYRHSGISSMNGITDANERVTTGNFEAIRAYAQEHHLARLTYWSANRDRPCPGAYPNDDTCSGVDQEPWQFAKIFAGYTG